MCHFEDDTANLSVGDSDDATLTGSPATVRGFVLPGECPLMAEAVSKLQNSFTPEVAFKHNVRRY